MAGCERTLPSVLCWWAVRAWASCSAMLRVAATSPVASSSRSFVGRPKCSERLLHEGSAGAAHDLASVERGRRDVGHTHLPRAQPQQATMGERGPMAGAGSLDGLYRSAPSLTRGEGGRVPAGAGQRWHGSGGLRWHGSRGLRWHGGRGLLLGSVREALSGGAPLRGAFLGEELLVVVINGLGLRTDGPAHVGEAHLGRRLGDPRERCRSSGRKGRGSPWGFRRARDGRRGGGRGGASGLGGSGALRRESSWNRSDLQALRTGTARPHRHSSPGRADPPWRGGPGCCWPGRAGWP
jgi:hypothetical protein